MDLALTETQMMVRDMARDFARREVAPVAEELNSQTVFPADIYAQMAPLGLLGMNIPDAYGGAAVGPVAYVLALMEIAEVCAGTAVGMSVTNMVAEVIEHFGTDMQKARYLPMIMSGEAVTGSFCLTEAGAGSDAGAIRTTAVKQGNQWILNGSKIFITSGAFSKVHIVWARTNDAPGTAGISAFIVDASAPGFVVGREEHKMGLWSSNTVEILLEDCSIPSDALLGHEGGGFKIAMMALDGGRIGIAAQSVGIARAALQAALEYSNERKQFGKPIGAFQATQWKLADMATELEAARLLVFAGCLAQGTASPLYPRSIHGQALCLGNRQPHLRPRSADSRRLWIHQGLSGGAVLPRRPCHHHLRRHQRNSTHGNRPSPAIVTGRRCPEQYLAVQQ